MSPSHSSIFATILERFERTSGTTIPSRVLVAVSGGADSMALLHVLLEAGLDVAVAHLDHGTRDGDSRKDFDWVVSTAESLGIACFVHRLDVPEISKRSKRSFEEVARHERYDFLSRTATAEGYSVIATGHHKDDQAETVLMRLVRGTSVTGLSGIPHVGEWSGVPLIRPLLSVTRREILDYVHAKGVDFREDLSNHDVQYFRNRVRHELLPFIREKYNSNVDTALDQLADLSREDDAFLREHTVEAMGDCVTGDGRIDRKRFRASHRSLQRRMIVDVVHRFGGIGDYPTVIGAVRFVDEGDAGRHYDLGQGVMLSNGRHETLIVQETLPPLCPVSTSIPGTCTFDGHLYRFDTLDSLPDVPIKQECSPSRQLVDADRLGDSVELRHRKDGDRFRPYGMTGSRKLKDFFGDVGIPVEVRDRVPLIVSGSEIVWVVGYAVSEGFVIRDGTKRGIKIEVTDGVE